MVLHENQNGRITDKNQLVSLSTDKVFKVWDLRTYQNLQTIVDNSLYRPENRISCLFFDSITEGITDRVLFQVQPPHTMANKATKIME